ncbi:hypothetical protein KKC83_06285 [Patescibacteria group bacterium]|nr:hypothetical protein [Candidatus Falkowbacteria bacterium]MBU3905425.1 hypothetical protein [Patescibacteria group bacterium]MCG2698674.1 hypothetical protein [Candidatus Parcubacteria bacterium]MBU4014815.1 hypothetical protein [Patescibacteria group bacterium]MBU4027121.1 hypothetical protein [Patescibacteria group bacterium]
MKYFELDKEEKKLLKDYEGGKLVSVSKEQLKKDKRKYQEYAKSTLNKTKNINIRLSEKDLQKVKSKAVEKGVPYQTLVSSVLHRYANGGNSF